MASGTNTEINTYLGQERSLRADRIGMPGLLLSVLAATAPLMVVAGVMPTAFGVMGIVGLPLLFVILAVVLGLFSVGYAEMSRHVHNAGAFYSYIARGLGGTAGAAASTVALLAYSAMQVGFFGIFGFEVSSLLAQHFSVQLDWWVPALVGVALVAVLGWFKIDLNAKVLGVLLGIEVAMVLVCDVAGLADPAKSGLSLHAFNPSTLTGAGVGTALCFCTSAFVGFEQAPVYAEETTRPNVLVARVMYLAIAFVGLFFVLGAWALTVSAGPSHIIGMSLKQGPNLLFTLTQARLGSPFVDVLNCFYVTGMFAGMLSFHNVVARYAFAMGREGLLPGSVGRTAKGSGAPAFGSLLQSVIAVIVVGVFALSDHKPIGDPTVPVLQLFTWAGNVGALGIIILMAAASLAVIVFFARRGAARFQIWRLIAAGLACLALLAIAGYTVKDFGLLLGADPKSPLSWILPGLVGLAAVGGLLWGLVLKFTRPEVHARIGLGNEAFQLDKAAASS
jgi:amino acid transporter